MTAHTCDRTPRHLPEDVHTLDQWSRSGSIRAASSSAPNPSAGVQGSSTPKSSIGSAARDRPSSCAALLHQGQPDGLLDQPTQVDSRPSAPTAGRDPHPATGPPAPGRRARRRVAHTFQRPKPRTGHQRRLPTPPWWNPTRGPAPSGMTATLADRFVANSPAAASRSWRCCAVTPRTDHEALQAQVQAQLGIEP